MAGLKNADDFQEGEKFKGAGLVGKLALVVGVAATLIFFVISFTSGKVDDELGYSRQNGMAYSWLFAVVFFLTLAVGGMFWTLLHHATNSGWGTVVRRLMENLGSLMPFMFLLALPLVLQPFQFRDALWEWFDERKEAEMKAAELAEAEKDTYFASIRNAAENARKAIAKVEEEKAAQGELSPGFARFYDDKIEELTAKSAVLSAEAEKSDEELLENLKLEKFKKKAALLYVKRNYLDSNAWFIRFLLYALVLCGGIWLLRSTSIRQDTSGNPVLFRNMRGMSCAMLLPFAVAWTFLVFDWLMALDYSWFSTMWGVYLFAGAALNSMGVLILTLTALRRTGHLEKVVTKEHYHIMGKLMHAFVVFWAYIAFSQYFLIWYANITEETKFFLTRNTGFWNAYTIMLLVVGHFFIPFIVLLIRAHKTTTWIICSVAVWNLIMHFFDIYWIIIAERAPSLTKGASNWLPGMWIFDLLAFVGVGGIFVFFLTRALGSASLYPCRDPRLDESLNLTN